MQQPSDITADIVAQLRRIGARFESDVVAATRQIYKPHLDLTKVGQEQIDVPYGPHERHRLDVYQSAGEARAIVVFIHGGGFVAGDKNGDGVFYRNIGRWLARNQMVAVLPNYRLAPKHGWPAGAQDVGSALEWVGRNARELSPGNMPVVLWGQSAGASHVASWLFDESARGSAEAKVDAVMMMSGFYQPDASMIPEARAYFGEDETLYEGRAPLTHVTAVSVPVWLGVAELDPAWIAQHTYALARAVTIANGRSPDFHFFRGHNHVSTVQSIGSPHVDAGEEVLRFLDLVSTPRAS